MIFQKIFWEKDPEKLVVASFLIEKSNLKFTKYCYGELENLTNDVPVALVGFCGATFVSSNR